MAAAAEQQQQQSRAQTNEANYLASTGRKPWLRAEHFAVEYFRVTPNYSEIDREGERVKRGEGACLMINDISETYS